MEHFMVILGQLLFVMLVFGLGAATFFKGCEAMYRVVQKADTISDVMAGFLILTVCTVGALGIIIFGTYVIATI